MCHVTCAITSTQVDSVSGIVKEDVPGEDLLTDNEVHPNMGNVCCIHCNFLNERAIT